MFGNEAAILGGGAAAGGRWTHFFVRAPKGRPSAASAGAVVALIMACSSLEFTSSNDATNCVPQPRSVGFGFNIRLQ